MSRLVLVAASLLSVSALAAPVGPWAFAPTCTATAGHPFSGRQCVDHHAYHPGTAVNTWEDELVVFLPGTSMEPDKHDEVARMAATAGFRTLVLAYDNKHPVPGGGSGSPSEFCFNGYPGDVDCHEDVFNTILWGPTAAPPIAGHTYLDEDSVQARLLDALAQLHATDMLDGVNHWGYDAYEAEVASGDWCRILIAGFSQGAQAAVMLGHQVDVAGVVMLDGTSGTIPDPASATGGTLDQGWISTLPATDGSAMFGAWHTTKRKSPVGLFDALGMPTGSHLIEESDPTTWTLPSATHRVEVDQARLPLPCTHHFSMGRDRCMPTVGGGSSEPLLADSYMQLFEDAADATDPDCLP